MVFLVLKMHCSMLSACHRLEIWTHNHSLPLCSDHTLHGKLLLPPPAAATILSRSSVTQILIECIIENISICKCYSTLPLVRAYNSNRMCHSCVWPSSQQRMNTSLYGSTNNSCYPFRTPGQMLLSALGDDFHSVAFLRFSLFWTCFEHKQR